MKKSSYAEIRIKRDGKAMTVPFCELKEGDETIAPGYPHLVCVGDAHDCGDASCDSLVVYDKDGEGFFPEDFMPTPAGRFRLVGAYRVGKRHIFLLNKDGAVI